MQENGYVFDRLTALLGDKAAEELLVSQILTICRENLRKATKIAYVKQYAFVKDVGLISIPAANARSDLYGSAMAAKVDQSVSKLLEEAFQEAKRIIQINSDKLCTLAQRLCDQEKLIDIELCDILGPRPTTSSVQQNVNEIVLQEIACV